MLRAFLSSLVPLRLRAFLLSLGCVCFALPAQAAADAVSLQPYTIFEIPVIGMPVTNAMLTSWVISLLIILGIRWMIGGKPKLIPATGQAIVESTLDGVRSIVEPIVGKRMTGPTMPLLIGFFVFILIHNWSGLIPGVGTFGHYDEHGHLLYYFRPGNADLNMTFALSIVAFVAWLYYVLRYAGLKALILDLYGNKADAKEVPFWLYYPLFVVFFGVGIIETISIMFRLVSLSFRLFGNVFGGENLLTSMHGLFAWALPIPFYFLEVLIGLIQAFVFTLLVAVYIGLVCNHGEEEPHA